VISGKEEARLIYLGVSSGVNLDGKEAAFIDVGGGSTEVIAGDHRHYHFLSSLNLGAIRLTSLFFLPGENGPVTPERYALLQRHVRLSSVRTLQQMRSYRFDLALGSSGTVENLTDIAARVLHNRQRQRDDVLPYRDLKKVIEMLCALPLEERRKVAGINPERADIIIAGAAIIQTLMQDLGFSQLRVIGDRGLREGLLIDYLSRSEHAQLIRGLSVRQRSVLQLGRACGFDEIHGKQVAQLALELFDSAEKIGVHHLGAHERELLGYAAQLHDIGAFLSYNNHHVHTYYLIRNAEMLGFDQSETRLMATTALFHRKALPTKKHGEMKELDKRSRKVVQVLSTLLRLAEVLDRGHTRAVRHARLLPAGKNGLFLEIHARHDCQLELWGAQSQLKAAHKALDREIRIKMIGGKRPRRGKRLPRPSRSSSSRSSSPP
jgi:exopolyphosphatase/guanosine-5'-triphosphate,3'-diphosphate pyrophosphatase